jgi:excinuclease ABC subunit C
MRGDKVAMLSIANENAKASFVQEHDEKMILEKTLVTMQEKLHLMNFPQVIECFDNSNMSGDEPVATMVAFTNGEKDAKRYRKYKIRTAKESDDYGAMYEVLSRRYSKAKQEDGLPSLIIVDGGKGQLNIALKVLSELDIVNVDVIGLAKEEGRHDKGATAEQVFVPNVKDPILLKRNSPILFLLQKIRDEAHRTAITFQRARRTKKTIKSSLDDIEGIGPAKRKILLKAFGSVKSIKEASLEQLQAVKGLSNANAKAVFDHLRQCKF